MLRRGEQVSISELHVDEDSYKLVHTIISINISCALLPKVHFDRHQSTNCVGHFGRNLILLRGPAYAVKLLARGVLLISILSIACISAFEHPKPLAKNGKVSTYGPHYLSWKGSLGAI